MHQGQVWRLLAANELVDEVRDALRVVQDQLENAEDSDQEVSANAANIRADMLKTAEADQEENPDKATGDGEGRESADTTSTSDKPMQLDEFETHATAAPPETTGDPISNLIDFTFDDTASPPSYFMTSPDSIPSLVPRTVSATPARETMPPTPPPLGFRGVFKLPTPPPPSQHISIQQREQEQSFMTKIALRPNGVGDIAGNSTDAWGTGCFDIFLEARVTPMSSLTARRRPATSRKRLSAWSGAGCSAELQCQDRSAAT